MANSVLSINRNLTVWMLCTEYAASGVIWSLKTTAYWNLKIPEHFVTLLVRVPLAVTWTPRSDQTPYIYRHQLF